MTKKKNRKAEVAHEQAVEAARKAMAQLEAGETASPIASYVASLGGQARAQTLSREQRHAIASKAAKARWSASRRSKADDQEE